MLGQCAFAKAQADRRVVALLTLPGVSGCVWREFGEVAQKHKIYLSGNAYELDPNFPQLYFQTCFIIDPSGDVILRYRRLVSMFAPTPHDVLDKYLDIYGQEAERIG